jgi:mannose-6-phosphate isomerase-like protein (cupin superfamily)
LGRAVTFASLPFRPVASGVSAAPITERDVRKMAAQVFRIAPGAELATSVPEGSDGYLFLLSGSGSIAVGAGRAAIEAETFVAVGEKQTFALANTASTPLDMVYVLAPPQGSAREHAGLADPLAVTSRNAAPNVYLPDQKKMRRYFVAKEAASSARGHAMIVEYEADTRTVMHRHPNAESMFVPLSGRIEFIINGEPTVLERGQAAYFGMDDRHALHCAAGTTSASFLEFHIPGAFTTVKE